MSGIDERKGQHTFLKGEYQLREDVHICKTPYFCRVKRIKYTRIAEKRGKKEVRREREGMA